MDCDRGVLLQGLQGQVGMGAERVHPRAEAASSVSRCMLAQRVAQLKQLLLRGACAGQAQGVGGWRRVGLVAAAPHLRWLAAPVVCHGVHP